MNKKINKRWMNLGIIVAGFTVSLFGSCQKDKMEWGRDAKYGEITAAELPLALKEAISRYQPLKNYAADFPIGIGIDYSLYSSDETYRSIVNTNFHEVTLANEMKHRWMVGANGQINFSASDPMVESLSQAGLKIYGHTLIWHQNQNASYLNSLIAPTIIPGVGGSLLDVTPLKNGTFTGWNRNNGGGMSVIADGGMNGGPALQLNVTAGGNEWDTQLTSPNISAVVGNRYEVSFWVKSDAPGNGRLSFAEMSNNYPWIDGAALFTTSGSWKKITYSGAEWKAEAENIKVAFDMGKTAGVYYIDLNTISVVDKDAPPVEFNHVPNGTFEAGNWGGWSANNPGAGMEVATAEAHGGTYSAKMTAGAAATNAWDLQLRSPELILEAGKDYTFSFYVKSDMAGKGRVSFPGLDSEYPWMNWHGTGGSEAFNTTTEWSLISVDLDNLKYKAGENSFKLSFDMGYVSNATYYLDDVKIVEKNPEGGGGAEPIIIEKTEAEKKQIITQSMMSWITGMVGHYKGKVHAWDVVNEVMNEAGGLRTGANVTEMAGDEFYWQDYIGKDFAVNAFKYARQADPDAKLFINDYNLETGSLSKVEGLIEYVQYIESQGAVVDGIGTQMHVSISTNKENIAQMFQKLAATGKLVKITELDIQVGTNSPTIEQYAEQAAMYRYVVETYKQYIPAAQQYGITVWSVSDHEREHEYWLPDDAPNLWDANYQRKHAYKGVADGLAGKDVSSEFSGELQY